MPVDAFAISDRAALSHFEEHGWVLVDTLSPQAVVSVAGWVDEVASWPESSPDTTAPTDPLARWLHYHEQTDFGPKLCRTENFLPFHEGLRQLLTSGLLMEMAGALLGEPAVLYKEKINYKLAGGAGYSPHQDAPAYPLLDAHVSCMVAVDDAGEENGCLEAVSGMHDATLPLDDAGCIRADVAASLIWITIRLRAGQTLWFHSRTPHRSGPNRSATNRRAIYPTYNAASEGDLRERYYREKLAALASEPAGKSVRVSLIGDFQGRPVAVTS